MENEMNVSHLKPRAVYNHTMIDHDRLFKELGRANPVAAALMAKMQIAPRDRPRVKLECLRLLATLKLDRARLRMISGFVDTYLRLTAEEMKQYQMEVSKLIEPEREEVMEIVTSWMEEGIEKGLQQGLQQGRQEIAVSLVTRQLKRRLGFIEAPLLEQVQGLSLSKWRKVQGTFLAT
jgi:hypothetical protein